MQFEVEKRAILNKEKLDELKEFLFKNAKIKKEYKRFTFVYLKRQDLEADPDNPQDLKVRVTNGEGEFSLKYGNWHESASREEYGLPFDVENIEMVLGMVKRLGHQWGIITYMHRVEFDYEGMTITVDDYSDFDKDLMEVEALTDSESDLDNAEKKIDKFFSEHNLEFLSSQGMQTLIGELNSRQNWTFDFTKQDIREFVEKWNNFILCKK